MASTIDYSETAKRQLKKLDKPVARRVLDFFEDRIAKQDDPRTLGKSLAGSLGALWRYRIGDFRAICEIQFAQEQGDASRVLVLQIGHRREVYRK